MQPELYVYPPLNEPLVEAYGMAFDAAYIVLHPFVRVPAECSWQRRRQYPSDQEQLTLGRKCRWAEAARATGLRNCAAMSRALLSSIGGIDAFLRDPAGVTALQAYLETDTVWMPTEGRFEPLLQEDFLAAFGLAGHTQLIHVPEFPGIDPVVTLGIEPLSRRATPFPERGTLLAPDASFLFTVDWDSFFTLFYGPRQLIERVANERQLEGFFAEKETEHFWFNWKMGCATCTVSPEGWSAS